MEISDKRFLITGCNGFVGRHLVKQLSTECSPDNIYGIDVVNIQDSQIKNTISLDICDYENVKRIVRETKPHYIIHLAADITPDMDVECLDGMVDVNVRGTVNLLKSVIRNKTKIKLFINMGTCEEYGNCGVPFNERSGLNPGSLYSGTKSAAHILCKTLANIYNIPVTTVRPSLIYGPGQSERFFITQAVKKLIEDMDFDMTEGEQTRDFIYIDDLVGGLIAICKSDYFCGEEVIVCSGREYKLRELISKIARLAGSGSRINFGAVPYRRNEVMKYSCDNSKIAGLIGWKPIVDIEEGLIRTIDYYKSLKHKN